MKSDFTNFFPKGLIMPWQLAENLIHAKTFPKQHHMPIISWFGFVLFFLKFIIVLGFLQVGTYIWHFKKHFSVWKKNHYELVEITALDLYIMFVSSNVKVVVKKLKQMHSMG